MNSSKKLLIDMTNNRALFRETEDNTKNIIKYKNKYVGDSNDGNLINALSLSEYGYTFEIDSENLGLIINYNITD